MFNLTLRKTQNHKLILDVSISMSGEQAIKIIKVDQTTGRSETIVDDVHATGSWLSARLIRERYSLEIGAA